jgi:hypothetical protein
VKNHVYVLVGFFLSACSSGSITEPPSQAQTFSEPVAQNECNGFEGMLPIDSDNVNTACYDESTRSMYVLFDTGGLYVYYSVQPQVWDRFIEAQPNAWSEVGYPELVKSGLSYRRIN